MQRKILWKIMATLISLGALGGAVADDETGNWTGNFAFGYQRWNAIGDLDTEPLGSFDDGGWNAVGSFNRRWRKAGRGDLLFGMNLAVRVHYADFGKVEAFGEDLGDLDGPITTLQVGLTYDW